MSTEDEKVKGSTAIRTAILGVVGAVADALIVGIFTLGAAFINRNSAQPQPITSPTSVPISSSPERRSPYAGSALGATVQGDVVWPTSEPIRIGGKLTLQGSSNSSNCSASVTFEAKAIDGSIVAQDNRMCGPEAWPSFGAVKFENSDRISQIDIILVVDNKPVRRVACPRVGDCRLA